MKTLFVMLSAMNLVVLAGALWLGWTGSAMGWTLPVVGVFVTWLLWSWRIWRVPGAEFDEAPENNGYVGHDGIHGFGLLEGIVLRWEDVEQALVRWYKGGPSWCW